MKLYVVMVILMVLVVEIKAHKGGKGKGKGRGLSRRISNICRSAGDLEDLCDVLLRPEEEGLRARVIALCESGNPQFGKRMVKVCKNFERRGLLNSSPAPAPGDEVSPPSTA